MQPGMNNNQQAGIPSFYIFGVLKQDGGAGEEQ